jgi:hypothetical protein
MYEIRVKYPVSLTRVAYWTTTEQTLDEAKAAAERNADHFYGEGEVIEWRNGRPSVVCVSNHGAPCETQRALVKRPRHV